MLAGPQSGATNDSGPADRQSGSLSRLSASPITKSERRQLNTAAYTADINDFRDELDELRAAFKDVVYSYAALLPSGWRVVGDFDRWLKGQACAGFRHGEIQPDANLMVGGCCSTVAELEMQLDRLFHFVCAMDR